MREATLPTAPAMSETPVGSARPAEDLRILKIAPTQFFADYGCHVRILEETLAIRRLGARAAICAYPGGRVPEGLDVRRAWGVPWSNGLRVGSSYHRFYLDAFLEARAAGAALRFRPHVVHAHLHEGALIGMPIARLHGIPLVFDFQGSLTSEMLDHGFMERGSRFFGLLRWLEGRINRFSDVILTSSHNAADLLVEQFGLPRQRVHAVPDAVDPARFAARWSYPETDIARLRLSLGVPIEARLVVYLGLLAEYQGSGHLLRAAARLCARRADIHFLLMGYPGHLRYQEYAAQLGIADRVTFTGRVPYEDAPRHLALGDVAVSPKLSETEGNGKLLNYMAVGLPTVTFETPVSHEILGPLGRYAALGDDAALADEIERLLDDPEQERISGAMRARAVEHFSWDEAGRRIVDIYRRLIET